MTNDERMPKSEFLKSSPRTGVAVPNSSLGIVSSFGFRHSSFLCSIASMVPSTKTLLQQHIAALLACDRCPKMHKPVVSGGPVISKVMLVGQAPGDKEPVLKRPFA